MELQPSVDDDFRTPGLLKTWICSSVPSEFTESRVAAAGARGEFRNPGKGERRPLEAVARELVKR
jgi:hypothetical protein